MTDASLMDADCIHGITWWECTKCEPPPSDDCECCGRCHRKYRPIDPDDFLRTTTRGMMVVCVECGNKRCPHANDHRLACTQSNDTDQPGSAYT